jgi:hypothetical protein
MAAQETVENPGQIYMIQGETSKGGGEREKEKK